MLLGRDFSNERKEVVMRKSFMGLGLASMLLMAATASAEIIPAWAGMPDPLTDTGCWVLSGGRLSCPLTSTETHDFDVPIRAKKSLSTGGITVHWTHLGCGVSCLNGGTAKARAIALDSNGLIFGSPTWKSNFNDDQTDLFVPAGGSVMVQFRFQGDGSAIGNSHSFSRIWTDGTLAFL